MMKVMKDPIFKDILKCALAQKGLLREINYLRKGLIYAPFLVKSHKKVSRGGEALAASSEVGDDIYPLF